MRNISRRPSPSPRVCTDVRSLARPYADVITKFSRLDGLPIFLTHGALLAEAPLQKHVCNLSISNIFSSRVIFVHHPAFFKSFLENVLKGFKHYAQCAQSCVMCITCSRSSFHSPIHSNFSLSDLSSSSFSPLWWFSLLRLHLRFIVEFIIPFSTWGSSKS